MNSICNDILENFSAITLNQLNTQASLMSRIESKFFIHENQLTALLKDLQADFYVLEIGGFKSFSYDNVYMDTRDLACYHAHNNGDESRVKMRTRHYVESDCSYFEFKNKKKGVMHKFRYDIQKAKHGQMDITAYEFINDVYDSLHKDTFSSIVFPSLKTKYQRCTLCHKETAEKITIDFNVSFEQVRHGDATFDLKNVVIVEFKTEVLNSPSMEIFAKNNMIELGACSKYCLGNYFLGNVQHWERFEDTITKAKHIMYSAETTEKKPKKQIKKMNKYFQTRPLYSDT